MDKDKMLPYFGKKQDILNMFLPEQICGSCKKERHIYVDNGAPFLLVAHIDTVQAPRLDKYNRGAGFDDRLGVYMGHKLCQERPELFDLLLTDYEEQGASTAEFFWPSHDYKLIIGLDREGDDYVDYGYASDELHNALSSYRFMQGFGSFSDICFMDHIEVNKINIGMGTYSGHSSKSGFHRPILELQIERLLSFCEDHRDTDWPIVVQDIWQRRGWGNGWNDEWYDKSYIKPLPSNRWPPPDSFCVDEDDEDWPWMEKCDLCGQQCNSDDMEWIEDCLVCPDCYHECLLDEPILSWEEEERQRLMKG